MPHVPTGTLPRRCAHFRQDCRKLFDFGASSAIVVAGLVLPLLGVRFYMAEDLRCQCRPLAFRQVSALDVHGDHERQG